MDNYWAIWIVVFCAVMGFIMGVLNWGRWYDLKRKVNKQKSITKIIDFSLTSLQEKFTFLESDFLEFIKKYHPELWVKFSLKDPILRKTYENTYQKANISFKVDSSEAISRLSKLRRGVVETVENSLEEAKLKHESSFEEKVMAMNDAFKEASKGTVFQHDPTQLDQEKLREVSTEESINYQHELLMARRFLDKRKSTLYLSPTGKNMLSEGYLDKSEVDIILEMALKGKLIQWIEKEYNQGCINSAIINTRKEATNV